MTDQPNPQEGKEQQNTNPTPTSEAKSPIDQSQKPPVLPVASENTGGKPTEIQPSCNFDYSKELLVRIIEDDELGQFETQTLSWARSGFWLAFSTLVIGVITLMIFYRQLSVMQIQLNDAETDSRISDLRTRQQQQAAQAQVDAINRQMRQDQRPWIGVVANGQFLITKDSTSYPIRFGVTPASKTPARDIRAVFTLKLLSNDKIYKLPPWNAVRGQGLIVGTLFPGQTTDMAVQHQDQAGKVVPLNATEIASFEAGQSFIIIYGVVAYKDMSGIEHWTQFCHWGSAKAGEYNAAACSEYNQTGDK